MKKEMKRQRRRRKLRVSTETVMATSMMVTGMAATAHIPRLSHRATEQTQRDRFFSSFRLKAKSLLWFSLLMTQRKTIQKCAYV
eukprot:14491289-Ditylum_brightwellii.AAC.1